MIFSNQAAWILLMAVVFAMADWIAVARNITWLRYSAKPLVIVALGIWLWFQPVPFDQMIWLVFALLLSLAGDVWLLAPPRFFIAGLISFLLAHVSYIIAFNLVLPPLTWQVLCLGFYFVIQGSIIYPILYRGVKEQPGARRLVGAILIYIIILSLMTFSATTTLFRDDWIYPAAACTAMGGLFFFFSDFLLAYDRFIRSIRHGRLLVHITYHLGQFGLIIGIVWQYSSMDLAAWLMNF